MPKQFEKKSQIPKQEEEEIEFEAESESESESESDGEDQPRRPPVKKVADVLKPLTVAASRDSNRWPGFLVTGAVVYLLDGKTVTSLVDVHSEGPFILEGQLEFEEDDASLKYLLNGQKNDAFIKIDSISTFSYGLREVPPQDPESEAKVVPPEYVALWAGSAKHGWFELLPSESFEPFYAQMIAAVQAYYSIQAIYKKAGAKKLKIAEVLYNFTNREGGGLRQLDAEAQLIKNARFLLEQMANKETVDLEKTAFYDFLKEKAFDTWKEFYPGENVKRPPLLASVPIINPQDYPVDPPPQQHKRFSREELREEDMKKSNPEWFVWMMEGLVEKGTETHVTMNCPKLWNEAYRSFSIAKPPISRELLRFHAGEVVDLLSKPWHSTKMVKELRTFVPLPDKTGDEAWRPLAKEVKLKLRLSQFVIHANAEAKKKGLPAPVLDHTYRRNYPRGSRNSTSTPSAALAPSTKKTSPPKEKTITVTDTSGKAAVAQREEMEREAITSGDGVEPKGSKRVPFSKSGKPSGKRSILHPAGAPIRPQDDEDDEGTRGNFDGFLQAFAQRPGNKRQRAFDSAGESAEEEFHQSSSLSNDSSDTGFVLVEDPLPQLCVNTRDGAWICDLETPPDKTCNHIIYDVGSNKASMAFDDHLIYHQNLFLKAQDKDTTSRQELVQAEAAKTNHTIQNLLAHLEAIGRADRLAEEAREQTINGKKIPKPIKRHRF